MILHPCRAQSAHERSKLCPRPTFHNFFQSKHPRFCFIPIPIKRYLVLDLQPLILSRNQVFVTRVSILSFPIFQVGKKDNWFESSGFAKKTAIPTEHLRKTAKIPSPIA